MYSDGCINIGAGTCQRPDGLELQTGGHNAVPQGPDRTVRQGTTDQVSEQDAGISVDELSRARPGAGAGPAMNLQPLVDRLIIEVLEQEETTGSGIVLPDTAREKPQRGRVLAVGPGARDEHGKHIELNVAAGDEVVFAKYGGTEIKLGTDDVLVLRESDVLAKVAAQTSKKRKRELAGATAH